MTFLPVVIAGFYQVLVGDKKKWTWLVLGFTGLMESHVLSTATMAVIFAACCLVFVRELFREKRWLDLLKAAGLTVLLNLWFLVPFLYFYLKENLYHEVLDWSGFSGVFHQRCVSADTFHTNDYRFLSLGLPVLGLRRFVYSGVGCGEDQEEAVGKSMAWKRENRFLTFLFWMACVLTFLVTGYFGSRNAEGAASCAGTAFCAPSSSPGGFWRLRESCLFSPVSSGSPVSGCCIRTES